MSNKKNVMMEQLYDMASSRDDDTGVTSFDEAKLKRELTQNQDKNFLRPNKEILLESEPKILTCKRYNPCPMCDKCKNKGSHLHMACASCTIPICVHDTKTINKMIVRRNFILKPKHKPMLDALRKLNKDFMEGELCK